MPNLIAEIDKTTFLPEAEKKELIRMLRSIRQYHRRLMSQDNYQSRWQWENSIHETLGSAFSWEHAECHFKLSSGYFSNLRAQFRIRGL